MGNTGLWGWMVVLVAIPFIGAEGGLPCPWVRLEGAYNYCM